MNKKTLKLTETSILIAFAVVLDLLSRVIPLFQMPQGGFVSLVLLPVIVVSLRHGFLYGFISGFVLGIISFMLDGLVIHWGSIIFDYVLAFSLVGLSAIFKKNALKGNLVNFILAITLASLARYLMHGISGVVFFSEYAGDINVYFYSFIVYNLPYNLVSYLFMVVSGIIIYPSFKQLFKEKEAPIKKE